MLTSYSGRLVDPRAKSIRPVRLSINDGLITEIVDDGSAAEGPFLLPGFVDAHVHIESSLLPPAEFGRLALTHGTLATVSDPHEIANVLGTQGVMYMLHEAEHTPLQIAFGAPSCVPATPFETAGAVLDDKAVARLLADSRIPYLSEMMNWPGVLAKDAQVMAKIKAAQQAGKPIDGHAPGLRGEDALRYAAAGISTDHECFTAEEAVDKLKAGMKVLIRQGSAARNFEALAPLLTDHWQRMMLCTDDSHPDTLVRGHINRLAEACLRRGLDIFQTLAVSTVNAVDHYALDLGLLQVGHRADFLVVDQLENLQPREVYAKGQPVVVDGSCTLPHRQAPAINQFHASALSADELAVEAAGKYVRTIVAHEGQLVTGQQWLPTAMADGLAVADPGRDLLKLVVYNRYQPARPAVAFIRGFGLRTGAIASTVAHDCHNIVAVGADDKSLAQAINLLVEQGGGLAVAAGDQQQVLPLPIGGLMSPDPARQVAQAYAELEAAARSLGSTMHAPFMTLSFMSLLVIPSLKLSDKGLFDGKNFNFVKLFTDDTMEEHREEKKGLEKMLADLGAKLDELIDRAKDKNGHIREDLKEQIERLEAKKEELEKDVKGYLKDKDRWQEVRTRLKHAAVELKEAAKAMFG